MKIRQIKGRKIDVRKASLFAIVVNGLELLVLLLLMGYMLFSDASEGGGITVRALVVVSAGMAGWGAVLDMRQAWAVHRQVRAFADLEQANVLMKSLNRKMRAQRHDFLNHLQVVYSLLEMEEYRDAAEYLEKTYGEIRSLSAVLRTESTVVNALLQAKTAACTDAGITFTANITSSLESMPMPDWELCRVLGNLLDNAMDATGGQESPAVTLDISENLREFVLAVRNPGEPIPDEIRERIFEPGVTTKGTERGMGLWIVRQTLAERGGVITCGHSEGETVFTATIPKGDAAH